VVEKISIQPHDEPGYFIISINTGGVWSYLRKLLRRIWGEEPKKEGYATYLEKVGYALIRYFDYEPLEQILQTLQ